MALLNLAILAGMWGAVTFYQTKYSQPFSKEVYSRTGGARQIVEEPRQSHTLTFVTPDDDVNKVQLSGIGLVRSRGYQNRYIEHYKHVAGGEADTFIDPSFDNREARGKRGPTARAL